MQLYYRKLGEGKPIVILHGLFGQSDNWNYYGKLLKEKGYAVYLVDARNHGLSPHSDIWSYDAMSQDLYELITDKNIINSEKIILIGHSMGGKTAMKFALSHQNLLEKLVIVDIAPKYYPPHHQYIIEGLHAVDLSKIKMRNEAETIIDKHISDNGTKQFLLKNLYWNKDTNQFNWRFNLKVIAEKIENIGEKIENKIECAVPTLFIKGATSAYIKDEDVQEMQKQFTQSTIETIGNAGHWVHVENPKDFFEKVMSFIR